MKKTLSSLLLAILIVMPTFAAKEKPTKIYILNYPYINTFLGKTVTDIHTVIIDNNNLCSGTTYGCYEVSVEPGKHTIDVHVRDNIQQPLSEAKNTYSLTLFIEQGKSKTVWVYQGQNSMMLYNGKNVGYGSTLGKLELKNGVLYDLYGHTWDENNQVERNTQSLAQNTQKQPHVLSDVDQNIPTSKKSADDTYVLIIANEEYQFLDPVNFASYDGETFKEYCIKTLGVPERQIRYCPNASYGVLSGGVDWLSYALNNFEGSRAIVYYCGHGIPDEKTSEAYIIPVDGKGTNTATCYSLNRLYKTLAETKAASITYFMDACFTGANKDGSMLVAARGVAREAKKETIGGKAIVFSASSGDETAMTYEEKQHGLFTYYLLKKLQETEGNVTYEDLASYISKNVKKDAFLLNEKPQKPVVATSPAAASEWKSMRLK